MPMATATAAPMPVATATMPVATARPMTSMPMPTATAEPFVPPMAAAPQPMTMAPQPAADDGDDRTIIGIPIIAAPAAPQRTVPIGSIPPGGTQPLWSARELAGTWINCCLPNGCFISHYTAVSEDKMKQIECCAAVLFVFPFPQREFFFLNPFPLCKEVLMRVRQGDTNRFRGKFDYDENGGESFESKTCWCEYHSGLPYDCYMKLLPI